MTRTYKIYMSNIHSPVYAYKTNKGFYDRLHALAGEGNVKFVEVYVSDLDKWYRVDFNPSPGVTWASSTY